ncbi:MAG: hypothetical protein Q9191_000398 [Dirinaria sp. TL-2023a]
MQQRCSLSVHDESASEADVFLNLSLFPSDTFVVGEVVRITAAHEDHILNAGTSSRQTHVNASTQGRQGRLHGQEAALKKDHTHASQDLRLSGNDAPDPARGYLFKVKDADPEMLARFSDVRISILSRVATAFGLKNRSPIFLTKVHSDVTFAEYLTRADMWHLTMAELADRTVYKEQKIWFLRTIKASVSNVFVNGQKVQSALFSASTKPIFRSESARYVLFIQMSKEMWDFDACGSGELMFNQAVDGFLPELLRRWQRLNVKHIVSVVLFTRIEYETQLDREKHSDFYRVVVSDMASGEWEYILSRLRSEFKDFLRSVCIRRPTLRERHSLEGSLTHASDEYPDWVIAGKPCTAARGNLLEAINLASSQFAFDHVDRDLVRTGVSIAVVTPGAGLFEVDHQLLSTTTENIVANGIGIDLICLSRMPLHSVPVFKYKPTSEENHITSSMRLPTQHTQDRPDVKWSFGIPYWVDVSFWTSPTDRGGRLPAGTLNAQDRAGSMSSSNPRKSFRPRVSMYELQMMGVTEEMTDDLSIPYIQLSRSMSNKSKNDAGSNDSKLWSSYEHPFSQVTGKSFKERESLKDMEFARSRDDQIAHCMATYDQEVFHDPDASHLLKDSYSNLRKAQLSNLHSKAPYPPQKAPSYHPPSFDADSKHRNLVSDVHDKTVGYSSMVRDSAVSKPLLETAKQNLPMRRNKSMRHTNFGFRGFGATGPKAVASTELTAEHAKPESRRSGKQLLRVNANNTSNTHSDTSITSRPSSMYSSEFDSGPPGSLRFSDAEDQQTTRPIPIRKATAFRIAGRTDGIEGEKRIQQLGPDEQNTDSDSLSTGKASGQASKISQAPLPDHRIEPWLVILNPSNPKVNIDSVNHLGKWQHVFPRSLRASKMKWRSLCWPAAVPITTEDIWPHKTAESCQEQAYRIEPIKDETVSEHLPCHDWLLKEMISLRLSYGFQVLVTPETPSFFDEDLGLGNRSELQLSKGRTVHRFRYVDSEVIEVTCFHRGTARTDFNPSADKDYTPFIQTILASTYTSQVMHKSPKREEQDWQKFDTFLAGRGKRQSAELLKGLHFWRARFVLIPVDPPSNSRRPAQSFNEDNEEEIRLEGIRKLTQLWQRFRYLSPDERRFQASARQRKDTNPLDIMYQTRNPSAIVAAEKEGIDEHSATGEPVELLPESELFQRSNLNLETLAQTIQGEKGVRMMDRRWHFVLHYNCFIGFELTTWLLQNFRDVDTREEAIQLGNELMANGLFQRLALFRLHRPGHADTAVFKHVQQRHNFRDGNYFYQVASEYRAPRAETKSWFGSRKSVPATPVSEGLGKGFPVSHASRSTPTSDANADNDTAAPTTGKQNLGVALSKSLIYDVDHRKKSHRPELINLHYDRLHNPDNCYHIRIEWLNTTSKLIEDAIISWATTVDRFGLKLVEVPLAEASAVTNMDPFRAPYVIRLARSPPSEQPKLQTYLDARTFAAPAAADDLYYQKLLLKKFDYVLDFEAARDFPADVDVSYSWGKPDYQYVQYIHRSGSLVVQITDDGNLLLLANRLYNDRSIPVQEERSIGDVGPRSRKGPAIRTGSYHGSPRATPVSSPIIQAISGMSKSHVPGSASVYATPEQLKDDLEVFCSNEATLDAFYSDVLNKLPQPGRRTPFLESTIPSIGLPPNFSLEDEKTPYDAS